MARRSLTSVRDWLRRFRASAAKNASAEMRGCAYEFTFRAAGDKDSDWLEITEAEFVGEDSAGGHPMPGAYKVRVLAADGDTVLEEREGEHVTGDTVLGFADRAESSDMAGSIRAISASWQQTLHAVHADNARLRTEMAQAGERERKAREEAGASLDAIAMLKADLLTARLERDEAIFQRDESLVREEAAIEELAAIKRRGSELAPVAESAVKVLVDRGIEQFLGEPPRAQEREAVEEAQQEVFAALVSPSGLPHTLALVHAGLLAWDPIRVGVITVYGVDPGETPPPVTWQPPDIPDDDEPNEAEPDGAPEGAEVQ